jgi:hypothetical protein
MVARFHSVTTQKESILPKQNPQSQRQKKPITEARYCKRLECADSFGKGDRKAVILAVLGS